MNWIEFYQNCYQALNNQTPLGFDCGRLCGGACCRVTPDLPGMYLLPGEEAMFLGKSGFSIIESQLTGYGSIKLITCTGSCNRADRPLACRVFPLSPKVIEGNSTTRLDPRGRVVCPLCHQPQSSLSSRFVQTTEAVFQKLLEETSTSSFILALSNYLDEYEKPIL